MKKKPAPSRRGKCHPQRILIVDDHPMTRQGVAAMLNREPDLTVSGEAATVQAALAAVEAQPPHLVLADLSLTERTGLELIKDLHATHPEVPVLAFSMHYESLYAERVLRAGGRGYIMKSEGGAKLVEAIRCVLRGEIYLSDAMRDKAVYRFAGVKRGAEQDNVSVLSDRELDVFDLLGQGKSTREIARHLKVSVSTVETHRAHIKAKLDLPSAPELVRTAVEWVTAGRQSS